MKRTWPPSLPAEHKKKVIDEHADRQEAPGWKHLCRMVLELAQNPSVSGQVFNVDSSGALNDRAGGHHGHGRCLCRWAKAFPPTGKTS